MSLVYAYSCARDEKYEYTGNLNGRYNLEDLGAEK
jgi:hypothetical protein